MTRNSTQTKKANCAPNVWNLGKIVSARMRRKKNAAVSIQQFANSKSARLQSALGLAIRVPSLAREHNPSCSHNCCWDQHDDVLRVRDDPREEPCPIRGYCWRDADGVYHCTAQFSCRRGRSAEAIAR